LACFSALVQFFKLFPELEENEFYLTGEVGVISVEKKLLLHLSFAKSAHPLQWTASEQW